MVGPPVSGMWPIITARRLPAGWQGDLAALTSPRVAALVDRARASRRGGAEYAAEEFASAIAGRDTSFAIVNLFEDLAGRGRTQLTAMPLLARSRNRSATAEGAVPGGARPRRRRGRACGDSAPRSGDREPRRVRFG
jgi:hypothetical protein